MKNVFELIWVCLGALMLLHSGAHAEQLWGSDFLGADRLFPIDVGREERPQPITIDLPSGPYLGVILDLASDPSRQPNVLWAILGGSGADPSLLAIDPLTRQTISAIELDVALSSLAIDPLSGRMYGSKASTLYTVDPSDGTIVPIGMTSDWVDEALGFDANGVLYGIGSDNGRLVRVDKETAQTSVIGTLRIGAGDLAIRPSDGAMFGIDIHGELLRVNLEDGSTTTAVVRSMTRGTGLAFLSIPEPPSIVVTASALTCTIVLIPRRRECHFLR
jgi:hypothetical protein